MHRIDARTAEATCEEGLEGLYLQLRRVAQGCMRGERPSHTLSPTDLVHEYLLTFSDDACCTPTEVAGVAANAGRAMRRILIDHARRRTRIKRGGGRASLRLSAVPIEVTDGADRSMRIPDLVAFDELLRVLHAELPQHAALIELRFFQGQSMPEAAGRLGLSLRSAERIWAEARDWLRVRLGNHG